VKPTIDIPEPLYRTAKIRAVEQGTSLKPLVLRALEQALSSAGAVTREVPYFARRKLGACICDYIYANSYSIQR